MEQIKAVNDAMSFLAMASESAPNPRVYQELREKHYNQLKESGASKYICDHFFDISGCLAPTESTVYVDSQAETIYKLALGMSNALEEKYGYDNLWKGYISEPRTYEGKVYGDLHCLENALAGEIGDVSTDLLKEYKDLANDFTNLMN